MDKPNPHRERDEAAEASVTRYNHKEPLVQYEMRKCGKLSFVQGWSAALANDPCVRALVEALSLAYGIACGECVPTDEQREEFQQALAAYRERTTPEGSENE